jgi:hypothetical protein
VTEKSKKLLQFVTFFKILAPMLPIQFGAGARAVGAQAVGARAVGAVTAFRCGSLLFRPRYTVFIPFFIL